MPNLQWRVLYRQFLFRIVDLEVLSAHAQGDSNRLLGQFAALLIWFSVGLTLAGSGLSSPPARDVNASSMGLVFTMIAQHFLIATTMLVVGLFAILSWDATFPDRRDVLVLSPLPVRARTMFLAKVAAVATSLGLAIALLHSAMGLLLPVVFASRTAPAPLPALTASPTPTAVSAADLAAIMDRDLKQMLTEGGLAPAVGGGLVIAVSKQGQHRVFAYGSAKNDSLFEIGSISKTFTGLMLARMVLAGKVQLNEPVRQLLPAGAVAQPPDEEITLLDLVTHHSGLPEWPNNLVPTDSSNPLVDYGPTQLYAYLANHGVAKPAGAPFLYSSLGFGLLGQVLVDLAGKDYGDFLREQIAGPLGMADTVVKLSPEQQLRFLEGYDEQHNRIQPWDFDAMAGAGAIRSTASDMLIYLDANLHPERYPALSKAIALSQQIRDSGPQGLQIAMSWLYQPGTATWQHNGATRGSRSAAFFNPRTDSAAVVLMNSVPKRFMLIGPDAIGEHIRQRLTGEPAVSLETVYVPVTPGFLGVLRSFAAYWFTMLASGIFVYCSILCAQGLAAMLLPRPLFLRLSGSMQLLAIAVIIGVYFLQPGFGGLDDLGYGAIVRVLQFLPSYWFLGLYQQINGSMHPLLQPLAREAWVGLAALLCLTPIVYTLSYWRTLRKIVEEPDILPGRRGSRWLPRFGTAPQTAIGQFSIRTLVRSRQHRLIVAFYLGIGFAVTCLLLKSSATAVNQVGRERSMLLWPASIAMMVLATVGTRVAFAMPLDLGANWIFRITGARGGSASLAASRRALLLLSVTPVWLATALACMALWPGWQNVAHLAALGFLGLIVADTCLLRFRKIPFTCSWLPGKSHFHITFLGAIGLFWAVSQAAKLEQLALLKTGTTVLMLVPLALVCAATTGLMSDTEEQEPLFEEKMSPAVLELGLHRDGVLIAPHQSQRP
jgi:CubicO group peptidase (beta-lactamase class C family)